MGIRIDLASLEQAAKIVKYEMENEVKRTKSKKLPKKDTLEKQKIIIQKKIDYNDNYPKAYIEM